MKILTPARVAFLMLATIGTLVGTYVANRLRASDAPPREIVERVQPAVPVETPPRAPRGSDRPSEKDEPLLLAAAERMQAALDELLALKRTERSAQTPSIPGPDPEPQFRPDPTRTFVSETYRGTSRTTLRFPK